MNALYRFHLAFPVHDLNLAKSFYKDIFGCKVGRESDKWIDFNLYGHQIVAHLCPEECDVYKKNIVDGDAISCRHFGVILKFNEWQKLVKKLNLSDVKFLIYPKIRFKNKIGEQGTFFIQDPSGNVLEFKTFKNDSDVFKSFQ